MPRLLWQVSTERILTFSMPASSIFWTSVLVDLLVGLDQHFVGDRIKDILQGHAAEDPVAERLDDFAPFDQGADR